jgi:hypothetical protein
MTRKILWTVAFIASIIAANTLTSAENLDRVRLAIRQMRKRSGPISLATTAMLRIT